MGAWMGVHPALDLGTIKGAANNIVTMARIAAADNLVEHTHIIIVVIVTDTQNSTGSYLALIRHTMEHMNTAF